VAVCGGVTCVAISQLTLFGPRNKQRRNLRATRMRIPFGIHWCPSSSSKCRQSCLIAAAASVLLQRIAGRDLASSTPCSIAVARGSAGKQLRCRGSESPSPKCSVVRLSWSQQACFSWRNLSGHWPMTPALNRYRPWRVLQGCSGAELRPHLERS
jgi:hypothetical protein